MVKKDIIKNDPYVGNITWWDKVSGLRGGMANGRYLCNEYRESMGIIDSLRRANIIDNEKIVCDLGCGTGIYHRAFTNTNLYGIDFSKASLDAASSKNSNVTYIQCDIQNTGMLSGVLERISPSIIIINNYIHYLNDEEVHDLIKLCLSHSTVTKVFIGDIPLVEKKRMVSANPFSIFSLARSLRFFLIRKVTKFFISKEESSSLITGPRARDYSKKWIENMLDSMEDFSLSSKWQVQNKNNMFYNSRENLIIEKKEKY